MKSKSCGSARPIEIFHKLDFLKDGDRSSGPYAVVGTHFTGCRLATAVVRDVRLVVRASRSAPVGAPTTQWRSMLPLTLAGAETYEYPHRSRLKVGSIPDPRPAPLPPPERQSRGGRKAPRENFSLSYFSRGPRRRQLCLPICQDARRRHRKDVAIRDPSRSRGRGGGSCSLPWLLRHVTLSPF